MAKKKKRARAAPMPKSDLVLREFDTFVNHEGVEIGADSIAIIDIDGRDVIRWNSLDWEEDPNTVIAIAKAIKLCYTHSADEVRSRISQALADMSVAE